MACFLAPVAEAIVVSVVKKNLEKKELAALSAHPDMAETAPRQDSRIPFSRKLGWLNNLLWGGSFLLAIEHIWHGEVVPWPPFLTAMNNPAEVQPMLMEILTVGGSMVILVTAVWLGMLLVASRMEKKAERPAPVEG